MFLNEAHRLGYCFTTVTNFRNKRLRGVWFIYEEKTELDNRLIGVCECLAKLEKTAGQTGLFAWFKAGKY